MEKSRLDQLFEDNKETFFKSWKELLSIPSISTNADYEDSCLEAAEWVLSHAESFGFSGKLLETSGKKAVFAEYTPDGFDPSSGTTVLFYGHYDVQPADPLELWESEPFEPEWRSGRLYARGAEDNKGQVMYVLKSLETLIQEGGLNCKVKLLIEGEEECGSVGLSKALDDWGDILQSDVLLVCDTGSRSAEVAAITMGLRGIVALTATLKGPRTDLHSGVHGGVCPNPARELARLVGSLHNEDGSVAVDGFYNGIEPAGVSDLEAANSVKVTPEMYEHMSGVKPSLEKGYTFAECRGFRPTLEINGIHSGYGGPGSKTIIPESAFVKISCRTVAGQDPQAVVDQITKHMQARAHPNLTLEITEAEPAGGALRLSTELKNISKASDTLKDLFGENVEYMWEGASIPIISRLAEVSQAEPVLVGFGLEEDNIHAPNESFGEQQFKNGFMFVSLFLSRL